MYQAEKEKIESAVGKDLIGRIEHIGSTAVPNLPAKPTIDIMIQVPEDTDALRNIIKKLEETGYHPVPDAASPAGKPPNIILVKGYTINGFAGQAYHIHLRYDWDWDEVYFRDYLVRYPATAARYATLKRRLAARFQKDREQYTQGKTEFISEITKVAKGL